MSSCGKLLSAGRTQSLNTMSLSFCDARRTTSWPLSVCLVLVVYAVVVLLGSCAFSALLLAQDLLLRDCDGSLVLLPVSL